MFIFLNPILLIYFMKYKKVNGPDELSDKYDDYLDLFNAKTTIQLKNQSFSLITSNIITLSY